MGIASLVPRCCLSRNSQAHTGLSPQLAATNRRVDQYQELVAYSQEERELDHRRQERMDAPVWRRAKWWLLGRDSDSQPCYSFKDHSISLNYQIIQ